MPTTNAPVRPFFLVNPGFLFRKSTATIILLAWFAAILWLTLVSFPSPEAKPNFIPFRSILEDLTQSDGNFVVNFLGNLAGFIPLGFFLPFARTSRTTLWFVIVAGIAISALIEVSQLISGHRVCDVDDILLNTISAVLGYQLALYWISREWSRMVKRSSKVRS